MDRRRFLRYGALGIALAGSVVVGYEYNKWQTSLLAPQVFTSTVMKTRTLLSTVTENRTLTETTTETVQSPSVHGTLFFDYNGNGKQDREEPAVVGALVQLKDSAGNVIAETLTDSSGDYRLYDIRAGSYRLHIGVDHFIDKIFRYMCTSPGEFRTVSDDYRTSMQGSVSMDVGLMEGYLTLPFAEGTRETCQVYVDIDPSKSMKDWEGGMDTYNGHLGTDFCLPIGTRILAAAPGSVTRSYYDTDDGNSVAIQHHDGNLAIYCHLKERMVSQGDRVNRGDTIALSGQTGKLSGARPHLHFQFGGYGQSRIDPYRNLSDPSSLGYWTVENHPQYPF